MKTLNIVAIVGSLRKDSYNRQLALAAGAALGDRAKLTLLDYRNVPLFNQDEEYPAPEAVRQAREAIKAADGVWFFTPEYNHYFPGVLKNLLDWLSRPISKETPQVLAGKPAAISGATPGMSGTGIAQDHLVSVISFVNMDVMNQPRLPVPSVMQQLDESGKLKLTVSAPFLQEQADAFVEFIRSR